MSWTSSHHFLVGAVQQTHQITFWQKVMKRCSTHKGTFIINDFLRNPHFSFLVWSPPWLYASSVKYKNKTNGWKWIIILLPYHWFFFHLNCNCIETLANEGLKPTHCFFMIFFAKCWKILRKLERIASKFLIHAKIEIKIFLRNLVLIKGLVAV